MLIFPKMPALRGKRATFEVNGWVARHLPPGGFYWPAGEPGGRFPGARLHFRSPSASDVELRVLNFAKLHAAGAEGRIALERVDNNGYHYRLQDWKKTAEGWT